ncbi:hypothetical protein A6A27_10590 [Micromonospora sp. CB01531]|nr:hypothetical protein A6A27_10590 [Micromonospora sp. CB01531]
MRTQADEHGNIADDCGHCTLLPGVNGPVRVAQVGCPVHSEHPTARRLRTQAERDADGQAWRAPGCTSGQPWICTPADCPGCFNPHCWITDGITCRNGCTVVPHNQLTPDQLAAIRERMVTDMRAARDRFLAAVATESPRVLVDPDIWVHMEPIAPPRRRWWHRLTRRAR